MTRRLRNSLLLLLASFSGFSQTVLTPLEFMELMKENHPVAKQAELKIAQSSAEVLASKGIFDPLLTYERKSKELEGKRYYLHDTPELSLFTPLGIKVKTGIETNGGQYLNPEYTNGVLTYAGVELPVLRGLLIDKKRATLQKAQIYQQSAEVERRSILNDLYIDALNTYWEWAAAYMSMSLLQRNLENAEERLELTTVLFENGDKARIDTVEAYGQVLNLQLQMVALNQVYFAKSLGLSQYLWDENGEAYAPGPEVRPDTSMFTYLPEVPSPESLIDQLNLHPDLIYYDFKLRGLEVERKLMRQEILPELNLSMNVLSKDYYSFESAYNPYLSNNYKFGVNFSMPLFLRSGRGKYQKATLKVDETSWARRFKLQELKTKVGQYDVELSALQQQVSLATTLTENYQRLLEVEDLKFSQGASSLFMINSRQNKLAESYLKLIELKGKYLKSWFKQQWAAGLLLQ
ncbi:TolC family protein [Jiulongibacter sp. NS-SX5]|uniref:TolC family protein n=1 Tax=Jiulongibacter sp. NS-SX5 TaxID=3463854 RepID=UPI004057D82A